MTLDEDPQAALYAGERAGTLARLAVRRNAAVAFRNRVDDALADVNCSGKALATVIANAHNCGDRDFASGVADDAITELDAAARHLRFAHRIAIGHERDLGDEIAAAEKEAGR